MCSMAILSVFICYFGLHTGIGFHYSLVYSQLNFLTTSVSVSLAGSRAPPPSPVALTIHLGKGGGALRYMRPHQDQAVPGARSDGVRTLRETH